MSDGRVTVQTLDGYGDQRVGVSVYRLGEVLRLTKRQAEELRAGLDAVLKR